MPAPPWEIRTGLGAVLQDWLDGPVGRQLVADRSFPAEEAEYGDIPLDLHGGLREALARRGIERLYQHQLEALASARGRRHTVVATPTASGKSLCFNLPVLDAVANEPGATAIYLYPTKALSRDQEASLHGLSRDAGLSVAATVYDGDTPGDARRAARQSSRIVMTNPDMLHSGILPQHASWSRVMQNLRYVVLDELHTYRGVFGSHVAHVLGRLKRIAEFHGASPTFIGATATIGNPGEHAARLLGVPASEVSVVARSTAPRGERRVLVYNPPVVNAELGMRASYLKSAVRLVGDLVAARVRTLLFGQSRNAIEIMVKYLRDRFASQPTLAEAIVSYRGGYLPDTRRRVERGLRSGELLCVVATNALELGIDVGELDAVVCAGYPGSVAETWQRFGRAGRRGEPSLAVMIASSAPLDQYLASHSRHLVGQAKADDAATPGRVGAFEHARIEPENTEVLLQHLKCAAFELPFRNDEPYVALDTDETNSALGYLADNGVLHRGRDRFHWASTDAFPANHVSLRRIGWDNFVIIDVATGLALAELDWHSTPTMLHEQAIYQHEGEQYQVERLDYENHKAYVRKVVPDYFTTAMRHQKIRVLEERAQLPLTTDEGEHRASAGWGEVSLVEKVVGYKKVKFHTHENAGYGDVRLPEHEMHTTSFWLTLSEELCRSLGRAVAVEGLTGLSHALELVSTLALMCDPHDLGRTLGDASPEEGSPSFEATAYLYDNVPCGVGLAQRIHERAGELLARAAELVTGCACDLGCPSCVGATALASSASPVAVHVAAPSPVVDRKSAALRLVLQLGLLRREGEAGRSQE
ncbi:MAG: DEAD/DEAH box helicase [Deltaproteobacteria bacterium]|nr:DEAD/DEAH box helicase [Deltaproteobacteria bacterium]